MKISDVMLHGVLNMPIENWSDDQLDKMQRHARYIQASMKIEFLEEKLNKIKDWCNAYPVSVFPEPDFDKMAKVLKDNGMTIDSIGASSMRHVLKGIQGIIGNIHENA